MSREQRDIVLDGPMPGPEYEDSESSASLGEDYFSSDSSFDSRAYLRELGIDYEEERRRMEAERDAQDEARREEYRRQQRERNVDELVRSLVGWGVGQPEIILVLQGREDIIDRVAHRVRHEAHQRQQQGGHPNSHSTALRLLRREGIPGSAEALEYIRRNWGERAEDVEREALRAEGDRIREAARGDYPASTMAILRGLGLRNENERLGEPIDIPDPQREAWIRLNLGVRQFLAVYQGDIDFTITRVLDSMIDFARSNGFSTMEAQARLDEALHRYVDRQMESGLSSEHGNGDTAGSLDSDVGSSDIHRRQDSHTDDATGRARPGLLDL